MRFTALFSLFFLFPLLAEAADHCEQERASKMRSLQIERDILNRRKQDLQKKPDDTNLANLTRQAEENIMRMSADIENGFRSCGERAVRAACAPNERFDGYGCTKQTSELDRRVAQEDIRDCRNASLYSDTSLMGQNCREAYQTIENVNSRTQAISQTTTLGVSTMANVHAMKTTGNQLDAQKTQNTILRNTALAKLVEAGAQGAAAAELATASNAAEKAYKQMGSARTEISQTCETMSGPQKTTCYAEMKERFGLTDTELAETQRIVKAYNETKKQGDAASTAFKQNAVQAAANTLVGIQALKMSQVAQQNAQNTGSLPPPVLGIAPLPNFAPTITPGSATSQDGKDFGLNGGLGDTALGNNGGAGIRGSIKGGRPMTGVNGFNAAKSTVSSAGGGSGGAGGRGGAGAGGRKSGSSRNLASSGVAGYESGGGARFGGANTQGNAPAQDTALTDAIKKLLGGDEAAGQANAVDPNRMVAGGEETYAPEAEGYGAYESDVSLFQQINAKYRQIYSNGML